MDIVTVLRLAHLFAFRAFFFVTEMNASHDQQWILIHDAQKLFIHTYIVRHLRKKVFNLSPSESLVLESDFSSESEITISLGSPLGEISVV